VKARELRATAPRSVPNRTIIKQEAGTPRIAVKSLKDMAYRSRMKALNGFSPVTVNIFRQGRRFLEESDTRKALVRYEDALHLEKRKRNKFGVAWCLLEIGRIYSNMGNHSRAAKIQSKTLTLFESINADDEIILTLAELGSLNSRLEKHELAASYFAKATARAKADEYAALRSSIEDLAKKNTQAAAQRKERAPVLAAVSMAPRSVSRVKQSKPKEIKPPRLTIKKRKKRKNSVPRYLAQLRRYNKVNDREKMIPVLESLSKEYEKTGDYNKVVHCLSVSLAYREERGSLKGISDPLERLARALGKRGRNAEALESYVRAVALSDRGKDSAKTKQLRSKAMAAAKRTALEPRTAVAELEALWRARAAGDRAEETRALHKVGSLFEQAGNHSRALKYFERATASMLVQKSRSQDHMGDVYAAEKSLEGALEIFKELDYPLYLNIKNQKRMTRTAAQESAPSKKD
jgi:tetratricopeptide (TPR) repeat protein